MNDGDIDGDGIPDFADGFDISEDIEDDNVIDTDPAENPEAFGMPMVLEIDLTGSQYAPKDFVYTFEYKASEPKDTKVEEQEDEDGNKTYKFSAPAGLRVWMNKEKTRNKGKVNGSGTEKGDFVPANVQIKAEDVKMDQKKHTFYVEALPGAEELTGKDVKISVKAEIPGKGVIYDDVVRFRPIIMQFVVPGENGDIVPTNYVGVCTPRPQVKLQDVTESDVNIKENQGVAVVTLKCDEVLDPVADNLPRGVADIESVEAYVAGSESPVASANVRSVTADAPSFWRQHPYKGKFSNMKVEIPLVEGTHNIRVQTSENAAELTGFDDVDISLSREIIPGSGGGTATFIANIYMPQEITGTSVDSVKYYFDNRDPLDNDPVFAEKNDEPASSEFYGKLNELDTKIAITNFSGLTNKKDTLTAEIPLIVNNQIVYITADFTETKKDSRIFRTTTTYTFPGGNSTEKWKVSDISNNTGSGVGICTQKAIRVKGLSEDIIKGMNVTLENDSQFDLTKGDEGWFYIKGLSNWYLLIRQKGESNYEAYVYDDKQGIGPDNPKWTPIPTNQISAALKYQDIKLGKIIASPFTIKLSVKSGIRQDEIFDVTAEVIGTAKFEGKVKIELSEGAKTMRLGLRGDVQIYDFGYDTNGDGKINPKQTELIFKESDNNIKRFKAIYNKFGQTIRIRVVATDKKYKNMGVDLLSGETKDIIISKQIRQYAEIWNSGTNPQINTKDNLILGAVTYWTDWRDGSPPYKLIKDENYRATVDMVKAVMFKESRMTEINLMQLTEGYAIKQMTGPNVERDWDWNAKSISSGSYKGCYYENQSPYMAYSGVADSLTSEAASTKWGVRWLYAKKSYADYFIPTVPMNGGLYRNPSPLSWPVTFSRYNAAIDRPFYSDAVNDLWEYGKNIGARDGKTLTPKTLWPILTNKHPRDE